MREDGREKLHALAEVRCYPVYRCRQVEQEPVKKIY